MIQTWLGGALLAAGLSLQPGPVAHAVDFHEIFEARCSSCHGHAGNFARETLTEIDGVLRGRRSSREVSVFLQRHSGGLSPADIRLFVQNLTRQLNSGAFYQDRCEICHDRAYELARLRLILRDGRLIGRFTGNDIAQFLPNHARMTAAEAERMLAVLSSIRQGLQ